MNWIRRNRLILSIVLIGILLRLPALTWGSPLINKSVRIYDGDEPKMVIAAVKFPPHLSVYPHPTFLHYSMGVLTLPIKKIIPYHGSPRKDMKNFMFQYNAIHLYMRIITLLFGIGTILMTYQVGRKFYNEASGLIAALFVSVSMVQVLYSTMAIAYMPLSFMFLVGFYRLIDLSGERRVSTYVQLGIIAGIIMGIKYTGIWFLLPLLGYSAYTQYKNREILKGLRNIIICLVIAFGVLFITTPTLFFAKTWTMFATELAELGMDKATIFSFKLWRDNFYAIINAVGMPLGILYIGGLLYPLKKKVKDIVLLVLIASFYVYFRQGVKITYVIPIIPVFALVTAHAVYSLFKNVRMKKTVVVATVLVMIYTLGYDAFALYTRVNDPRTETVEYINENIPTGTTIGVATVSKKYPWRYHGWRYPNVDFRRYKEKFFLDNPEIVILTSYDFERFQEKLGENEYWYRFSAPSEDIVDFYTSLLHEPENTDYELVETFKPKTNMVIPMSPPEVRVYRKRVN